MSPDPTSSPYEDDHTTDAAKETAMNRMPPTDPTMPFRVEPATPVPDDAVNPDAPSGESRPGPASHPAPSYPAPLVTVHTGPRPGTVMLGLLALLVAAFVVVRNATSLHLDLAKDGPMIVAGVGGLLLLVGLTGVLLGLRRRRAMIRSHGWYSAR